MGLSQKKTSQQSTQNQQTHMTTAPNNPAWVDSGLANMGGYLDKLSQMDPRSFVAGPDPLQTQAANAASGLGHFSYGGSAGGGLPPPQQPAARGFGPQRAAYDPNLAAGLQSGLGGNMGAAYTSTFGGPRDVGSPMGGGQSGYDPTGGERAPMRIPQQGDPDYAMYAAEIARTGGTLGQPVGGQGAPMGSLGGSQQAGGNFDPYASAMGTFDRMQSSGPNTYNPAMSGAAGYNATTGQATTYNPTTGQAQNYGVQTGNASHYDPTSYGATTGSASMTGDSPQVQSQSLLDNLGAYMSPYTNDVVNTTLAGFDQNAGRTRASQMLDLANDSTFGGSGGSILRSMTEGELSRGRAQTEAQLRDSAFQTGAGLSGQDADRRQSASSQNSAQGLQRALADMSAKNTFGLHNMDALNTASRDNANAANVAGQYNAGNDQDMSLANLGFQNTANRDNANASNTFGLANMDAANTASRDNAVANNSFGLANMDALNGAGATNAGFRQQTNLANQGAFNNAGQFNAGQRDIAAGRQMEGARGLVSTANDQQGQQRANISTQADIGSILQQLAQQRAGAPLAFGAGLTSMWGGLPLDLLHGSSADGTMNGTSTGTGKESGAGLGDWLNYFASNARAASGG